MADTVIFKPYLVPFGFAHNISPIELNDGVNTLCSIRESKIFTYSVQNNSAVLTNKEFELTIVVLNANYRNSIIDVLTAPASAVTRYGILEVNGWMLVCQCIGISEISNEEGGKYKFKARFYTPDMTWIKKYGTFLTNFPTPPDGNRFWYDENASKISEEYLELPEGQYGFSLEVHTYGSQQSPHTFVMYAEEKYPQYGSNAEEFTEEIIVGYEVGKSQVIKSDFLTKAIQNPNGSSYINFVPVYSDVFVKMPYSAYKLSTNTIEAVNSYDKITVYKLRGMPEWEL